jgi:hypothetical protein
VLVACGLLDLVEAVADRAHLRIADEAALDKSSRIDRAGCAWSAASICLLCTGIEFANPTGT